MSPQPADSSRMRCELLAIAALLVACRDKAPTPPTQGPGSASTTAPRDAAPTIDAPPPIDAPLTQDELDRQESLRHHEEWKRELAAAIAPLPPTFQALFTLNSQEFREEVLSQFPLTIQQSGETTKGQMRCFLHPDAIPGGMRGMITCAPFDMGGEVLMFTFDIIFIATRDGLWIENDEELDDVTKLDPKRMVMAAIPAARRTVLVDKDRTKTTYAVRAHGDAWCIERTGAKMAYLCLRAGDGIIGGGGKGPGMNGGPRTETWGTGPGASW